MRRAIVIVAFVAFVAGTTAFRLWEPVAAPSGTQSCGTVAAPRAATLDDPACERALRRQRAFVVLWQIGALLLAANTVVLAARHVDTHRVVRQKTS